MDYLISIVDQFSPQLRSMRKSRKLSQKDLALRLGVSQSRIAAIERNPATVSAGQLLTLLNILEVGLVLRDQRKSVHLTSPDPANKNNDAKVEW